MVNFCLWYIKEFLRSVSHVFWAPLRAVSVLSLHWPRLSFVSSVSLLRLLWGCTDLPYEAQGWTRLGSHPLISLRHYSSTHIHPEAKLTVLTVKGSWPIGKGSSSSVFSSQRSYTEVFIWPPGFGPFRFYTKRYSHFRYTQTIKGLVKSRVNQQPHYSPRLSSSLSFSLY